VKELELAIVGGGIAGMSCAVYAKRAGLNPVIFEKAALGGQLMYINRIDNYPAVKPGSTGAEFLNVLSSSVKELNIEVKEEAVTRVAAEESKVVISSDDKEYSAGSLVVASGASFRKLGVEGEDKFAGRGVSWCAVCDGYFFRDKKVAIVGGGNTAVEDAIYLSSVCSKVYLIHRRDKLRALDYLQKELFDRGNIEIIWNSVIKKISGDNFVKEIEIENVVDDKKSVLETSALFIAVGIKPNTDICAGIIDIDNGGFVITDEYMKTSCDYIYACGDCRKRPLRQLITAASEGAIAALSAYRYLKNSYVSY